MPDSPDFIHLRVHSEYSVLSGALRVKTLPGLAAQAGMPALALTDANAMFAALEFSEGCAKAGVQPIVGMEVALDWEAPRPGERPRDPAPIVLLAQSEAGYRNLMALTSHMYMREAGETRATLDEVLAHAEGLICLTGGPDGPAGRLIREGKADAARALVLRLAAAFPRRLYVELQRHPGEDGLPEAEALTEGPFLDIAYDEGLPIVATNDAHFAREDEYEAHDAFLAIAEGAYVDQSAPRRRLTPEHRLKTPAEMRTVFADLPEALERTVEIARRCAFRVRTRPEILPTFAADEVAELRRQAAEGLRARLEVIPHAAPVEDYEKRLEYELGVIEDMGFPGYFLIVADFIKWAKDQAIPVGPGRGSGAGSLVAYALTITDLDPLRYDLLFERFLNPQRISMPDFDIDFCMDRRMEVVRYVQAKYGHDRVGQIITFGAMLSKAAVRDVGRVLQMPFGQTDRLSKMIPMVAAAKPATIPEALRLEPRLAEERKEPSVDRLLDYCARLEGLLRNASTHAAGVVIGDRPLQELVPLYRDPRSDMPATQFNMKWVEKAGLVKFDFLGLKTLTQIQNALDILKARGEPLMPSEMVEALDDGARLALSRNPYDIAAIPLDDAAAYELYASGKTVAVFQVESAGMVDALRRMRPTAIEDIVALVALYRPGPMENIPQYCDVKNGRAERQRIHPLIDHILDETQGIIVYQEQVMEIARKMAGYTLGGADMLRRAMGKKIQSEMDAQRPLFLQGAAENGVPEGKAIEVWNLLDKFANYGFNKSHAAAYAVVSYQTAWLKARHPVAFMAGIMNSDIHLTDKLAVYAEDVRHNLKIRIVPPCVNRSGATFATDPEGGIVYALGALKNVGVEAMCLIVEGRGDAPFATLFDLARRVDLRRVGKRPVEMLARAGAFDQLDPNRARALAAIDPLLAYSGAHHDQAASSQTSLFGGGEDLPEPRLPDIPDWLPAERLTEEHRAIGFYLSGHPLDDYMPSLRRAGACTYAEAAKAAEGRAVIRKVAGTVAYKSERTNQRGNRFAFVGLSDPSGAYEVRVWSEVLEATRDHLVPGANVTLQLEASSDGGRLNLLARSFEPIDENLARAGAEEITIYLDAPEGAAGVASLLQRMSGAPTPTRTGIRLALLDPALPGEVEVDLGGAWPVSPQVRSALKAVRGVAMVE